MVYDNQYTAEAAPTQVSPPVRGGARRCPGAGGGLHPRLRSEAKLTRVIAQAATSRAVVQLAETLQRSLGFGRAAAGGRVDTAVRYLPATRHAQVGGDWYDAFPVPDGSTMLAIGDVAGHDAPAAAAMSQTSRMLRAIAQSVVARRC